MPVQVLKATGLAKVIGAKRNDPEMTLSVAVDALDQRRYELEFTPEATAEITGVLLTGLAALYEILPPDRRPVPTVVPERMELAMSPEGQLALKIALQSGGELAFPLEGDAIASMRRLLDEAATLSNRPRPN